MTEEELIDAIEEMREWAAESKSKQAEKAHAADNSGDDAAKWQHEGERNAYHNVERVLTEKVCPLMEEPEDG